MTVKAESLGTIELTSSTYGKTRTSEYKTLAEVTVPGEVLFFEQVNQANAYKKALTDLGFKAPTRVYTKDGIKGRAVWKFLVEPTVGEDKGSGKVTTDIFSV